MHMNKQQEYAIKRWSHWAKYHWVYFIVATATFILSIPITGWPNKFEVIIGFVGGVSILIKTISDIKQKEAIGIVAALASLAPVLAGSKVESFESGAAVLVQVFSVTGVSLFLGYAIAKKRFYPNNALQRTSR